MKTYRNAQNTARASQVERTALVGEAGEVFTPPVVVQDIINSPFVTAVLQGDGLLLEPAAGDGNFVMPLLEALLTQSLSQDDDSYAALTEAGRLHAVEILDDNLEELRKRALALLKAALPDVEEAELKAFCEKQYQKGSYLTGRACTLSCTSDCSLCGKLSLPESYSLVIGNPPYNPNAVYTAFVEKALDESERTAFVLPTTWKMNPRYKNFRNSLLGHLVSVTDLPWKTFAIKLRTCVVFLQKATTSSFILNGVSTTPVDDEDRVMNSILTKAFSKWDKTLLHHRSPLTHKASIGWKCNLERDKGQINYLQSVGFEDTPMPHNVYDLYFSTPEERLAFVKWSCTKLAAYFQYCVDNDTVARYLPIPPLTLQDYSDEALYEALALTEEEIAQVEAFTVFVSARAKKFYDEVGVKPRSDVVVGRERTACPSCGSSSFHRKGCANSTPKEKELRDGKL